MLFFLTYIGFRVLHAKDYLMQWHESIRDIDLDDKDSHALLPDETRRRLNVRILLKTQSQRFKCFFSWLTILTAVALSFVIW